MNKVVNLDEIKSLFEDGMTIMIGGFLGCGSPEPLIDLLVEMNIKDITLIANDSGFVDRGCGKLVTNNQVKKVIVSHVGTNPKTAELYNAGEMEVELSPQGTLVERVRAGGHGLGGVLTPTGLGTLVEEGKQKVVVDGKEFLVETPLRADIALVYGTISDTFGNTFHEGTTKNFNPIIAMAADKVIVCTEELVEVGELDIEKIMTLGVVVDYVVNQKM